MKRIVLSIIALIIVATITPITSYAETYEEAWLRKQQERYNNTMKELEKDGNLTESAKDALTIDGKKKTSEKAKNKEKSNNNNSSQYEPKGWVYSSDELHVVGLPEDESGYTKAGDYGAID